MIDIKGYFDALTCTVSYLVVDSKTSAAAVIDPILDFDLQTAKLETRSADIILEELRYQKLDLVWSLETHIHADHLSAAEYIRTNTGAKSGISSRISEVQESFSDLFKLEKLSGENNYFDLLFEDGSQFELGSQTFTVLHTPGHTPACVTYIINNYAFVGDTLFMPDYGTARTDFRGGNAQELYRSIQKILELPENYRVLVGHDYCPDGRDYPIWESSISEQRALNVHVGGSISEGEFVSMREDKDRLLSKPGLMLPALEVNLRGGCLPIAEINGTSNLSFPVKKLV